MAARYQADWADLADWKGPDHPLDALVLVYCHLPAAVRARAYPQAATALKPGGWCIVEGFHPQQLQGYASGGPKDADMLLTLAALRADLGTLCEEVLAVEGEVVLDEGGGHQGPGYVTRWLGRWRG